MVKVDLESAKAQIDSLQKTCNNLNDQVNQVQDAIEQFIDNDDLKGKGYQAAKEFGATVMINAWRAVRVAFEAVRKGASQMIENYKDTVDTKSWSDEELDEKIQTLEQHKSQLEQQVAMLNKLAKTLTQKDNGELMKKMGQGVNKSIKASNKSIDTLGDQIQHFKEIKQHLQEFDAKSSSFMADAQSLISMATKGISEINNGLNPKNGESTLPDDGQLTWIDDVNEKASKYDSRKEQFIDTMSDTYGLDDEDAKDLYELQQGIEKYAKKHHRSGEWAVYEFNRIIASLGGYGINGDDRVIGGAMKTGQWSQAGCISVLETIPYAKHYAPKLSEEDLKNLSEHLRIQHSGYRDERTGKTITYDRKSDLAHESVIIASYLSPEVIHINFIHQRINNIDYAFTRLFGMGADYKNYKIESDFNDNVSYRGDIKSGIQGASERDLESDADADNIYARVKKTDNVDQALNVMTDYHSGIAEGSVDRKEEFLKNHGGWEAVEDKIDSVTPEDLLLGKYGTAEDVEGAKKKFKNYLNNKNTGFEALFNNE